jgi:hypothetical protein
VFRDCIWTLVVRNETAAGKSFPSLREKNAGVQLFFELQGALTRLRTRIGYRR